MTIVNDGQRTGNNLFYIFEEFSVDESEEAVFENAVDAENIFAFVWGNNTSSIGGRIQTQGKANFFLVIYRWMTAVRLFLKHKII